MKIDLFCCSILYCLVFPCCAMQATVIPVQGVDESIGFFTQGQVDKIIDKAFYLPNFLSEDDEEDIGTIINSYGFIQLNIKGHTFDLLYKLADVDFDKDADFVKIKKMEEFLLEKDNNLFIEALGIASHVFLCLYKRGVLDKVKISVFIKYGIISFPSVKSRWYGNVSMTLANNILTLTQHNGFARDDSFSFPMVVYLNKKLIA